MHKLLCVVKSETLGHAPKRTESRDRGLQSEKAIIGEISEACKKSTTIYLNLFLFSFINAQSWSIMPYFIRICVDVIILC